MTETIDKAEAERHRAKMAKRKAVQDAEVAEKKIEKGFLIVHTGTGKGKSTAAFGLALRMLGRGHRVGVVQFIKGAWHTAERDALAQFGEQIAWYTMGEGFTWETQDRARDVAAAERAWSKARELMADLSFDSLFSTSSTLHCATIISIFMPSSPRSPHAARVSTSSSPAAMPNRN